MSVIIRLQGLPWSASAMDIRQFFKGLNIPPGGVHIIGGEKGDAFIAFVSDEDARKAMMLNNGYIDTNSVQLYLSSKTEMQNVIGEARNQTVPAPGEQPPPAQPQPTQPPYPATEYTRNDPQGHPIPDRSGDLNREYNRPPEEYGRPPSQLGSGTPGQDIERQPPSQSPYDNQSPRYPERSGQPHQMPPQRDDIPKPGYWPPNDRRSLTGDPPNLPRNNELDRFSSHSQYSQSGFMNDRVPPRDGFDRLPPPREGPFEGYPPPGSLRHDRPPETREGYPDRPPNVPDPRQPRPIYPDNYPSSDHRNNSNNPPWDPHPNPRQPPPWDRRPGNIPWEARGNDASSKPAWEAGPPFGHRPDERPPIDPQQAALPGDQARFMPPRHGQGGFEGKRFEGRPPSIENRQGIDERGRLPPPHGNIPLDERPPSSRPYDPFDPRLNSMPRNDQPNQHVQGVPQDHPPRPSGLLATPSDNMKLMEENSLGDKRYLGIDMDNRDLAPNMGRPPVQGIDAQGPPDHDRGIPRDIPPHLAVHVRPPPGHHERPPHHGQYGQPRAHDDPYDRRAPVDQFDRPLPEVYERQNRHEHPDAQLINDPFERPPPQHYERQSQRGHFDRLPHEQFDRPYDRPLSQERVDRPLHGFPERPPHPEDREPHFGERPPHGRPFEHPLHGRPPPQGFPPGRPPISHGDRPHERHDISRGRPQLPPSEGSATEVPVDIEKDQYLPPRSMQGPPLLPPAPHGFPPRHPLTRPQIDERYPPHRPPHGEEHLTPLHGTPRMSPLFHPSGPSAMPPHSQIPGQIDDPDMRNKTQKDDLKKEDGIKTKNPQEPEKTDDKGAQSRQEKPLDVDARNQRHAEKDAKQDIDSRRGRDDDSKSRGDDRRDRDLDSRERRRDSDRSSRDDRSRSDIDRRRLDYDRRDDRRDYGRPREYDSGRFRDFNPSRGFDRSRDYDRSRIDRDRDRYRDDRDRRSPRDSRDRDRKDEFGRDKRPDERDSKNADSKGNAKSPAKSVSSTSTTKTASLQSIPVPSQTTTAKSAVVATTTTSAATPKSNWKPVTSTSSVPATTTSNSSATKDSPKVTPTISKSHDNSSVSSQQQKIVSSQVAPRPLMSTSIPCTRPLSNTIGEQSKQPGILGAAPPGMQPLSQQGMRMTAQPRRAANDWEQKVKVPLIDTPPNTGPSSDKKSGIVDAADPKGLKRQYRQSTPSLSLVVKNLPMNSGYRDVRKFFQGCEIPWDGLKMINDNEGRRAGKAYVNFCSSQAYFDALERNGRQLNDNVIDVRACPQEEYNDAIDSFVPPKDAKRPRLEGQSNTKVSPPKPTPNDNIVQLKGWANSVNMEELKKFFKDYKIAENGNAIYIEQDQHKRPTGMAMIKFDGVTEYNRALALDMKQLAGKSVHIKPASQHELTNLIQEQKKLGASGEKNGTGGGDNDLKCEYTCVHLRDLPAYTTVQDLQYTLFTGLELGSRGVHLVLDSNGKSLGEAFAEFSSESDCARALKKDGEVFMGKAIGVKPILKTEMIDMLRMTKQPSWRQNSGPQFQRRSTYYVKTDNWPFTISIREVLSFFQGFNPIQETVRVQIGNDMQGSAAMVGFRTQEDADRAVSTLNNKFYRQRPIRMELAHM